MHHRAARWTAICAWEGVTLCMPHAPIPHMGTAPYTGACCDLENKNHGSVEALGLPRNVWEKDEGKRAKPVRIVVYHRHKMPGKTAKASE